MPFDAVAVRVIEDPLSTVGVAGVTVAVRAGLIVNRAAVEDALADVSAPSDTAAQ